jgi:hypothetical protein
MIKIYTVFKTLPVTLYGSETWFPDLRKGYGLNVFENRALKGKFGLSRKE